MLRINNFTNLLLSPVELTPSGELPDREQIEEKYKWNLKDIYQSDELWEKDFVWVEQKIPEYDKFQGTITQSGSNLLECLKFDDEVGVKLGRLYLYSMLSKDLNLSDIKYMALDDRIKSLFTKVTTANSFIHPELLSVSIGHIRKMYEKNPELKNYDQYFDDLFRVAEHTLGKEQEEILALTSELSGIPYTSFSLLTNADLKFPVIKDGQGNDVNISHARFYAALYSEDRTFRENAYKAYYKPYMEFSNTFSSLLNGGIKANMFTARARKFANSRESALSKNNIPVAVYNNLVETVNNNFAPIHRWTALKKKLLGVDELHPYDTYVSLFQFNKKYSFETGKKLVLDSLERLGPEYLGSINKAFENQWLDVYETKHKKSGAYSSGSTYGVHPYVLLNWTDLINDVFTLTHEMGHNMHSYYTGLNQPFVYANYSIFLAEIASTFNENLLLDYLIQTAKTNYERLALLEKYVNNITTTFYRQVMFAEFEQKIHEMAENGSGLTPDAFRILYKGLYQKYWGPDMVADVEEEYTWARIPHFYYNFYVYQYATGFAASEALVQKIKTEGDTAVTKYLNFLKAGSSDYPINILKNTGVDMTTSAPFLAVIKKMNECIDQIEELI